MSKEKVEKAYFPDNWLDSEEFKESLVKVKDDNTQARCRRCQKVTSLSNMGIQTLKSHASGKRHKEITQKVSCFFSSKQKDLATKEVACAESSAGSSFNEEDETHKTQQTLELTLATSVVTKAEIRWTVDNALKGNPNNQNLDTNDLFETMFLDSKIAKLFSLVPDKLRYACNYGLAPHFHQLLTEKVQKSEIFVISFDESLNDSNQKYQKDSIITFLDHSEQKAQARFWSSSYRGHSTHSDLLENFISCIDGLDPSRMVRVSMDGPSVRWKFYNALSNQRDESKLPTLIDTGSCSLHIVNGAFQSGAEKTGWRIKQTLKGVYKLFHDSPARREDYENVTGFTAYPLAFCSTR